MKEQKLEKKDVAKAVKKGVEKTKRKANWKLKE